MRRVGRAAVLLAIAALACRKAPARDLVREFPWAERVAEPGLIDLGTPAARAFLRGGWSIDESAVGSATNYVWSLGPRSALEFTLPERRDLLIRVRAAPLEAPALPPQTVTATLNGAGAQSITLARGMREYQLGFLAGATRQGSNRLELRYGWTRRPSELAGGRDRRELAVCWDKVHVVGLTREAETGPMADPLKKSLFIPWGSSVRYYLDLPAEGRFSLDGLTQTGRGRLDVRAERDGAPEVLVLSRDGSSSGSATARVPFAGIARLSLAAVGERAGAPGGLTVTAPSVSEVTPSAPPASPGPRSRPPVVIYLIDTLRADHLGCYGYARPVTPRIDTFARESIVFENAVSETSWTRPAVASLFTGLPPRVHGVNGRDDALPEQAVTMAEILSGLGYETDGFTVNGNVAPLYGFGQGFGRYELLPPSRRPGPPRRSLDPEADAPPSSAMVRRLSTWFAERRAEAPLLLYVHTADPHSPYNPPPEWRARFAPGVADPGKGSVANLRRLMKDRSLVAPSELRELLDLYDAEIAAADFGFGQVLDELRRRRLYEEAAILLVADHGEEFWDHGFWEHGCTLHAEVVRVPLVLKLPTGRHGGLRVRGVVQLADVLPTLLDLLGEPVPRTVTGRSLLARLNPASAEWSGRAYSFLDLDSHRAEAAQADGFKLVRWPGEDGPAQALFDLVHDPGERSDVSGRQPIRAGYVQKLLDTEAARERPLWSRRQAETSREVEENLRALGYVQ